MLSFPPSVRIWLATKPTDMRKSFDTLAEVVRQHFARFRIGGSATAGLVPMALTILD